MCGVSGRGTRRLVPCGVSWRGPLPVNANAAGVVRPGGNCATPQQVKSSGMVGDERLEQLPERWASHARLRAVWGTLAAAARIGLGVGGGRCYRLRRFRLR